MKNLSKWVSALLASVFLAGTASAADAIAAGTVKAVNADKKALVLTDAAGKDSTIKLGDNLVINRGGKESKTDVSAGDRVNVCYDKGLLTSTAHYILVQEGDSKDWSLMHGTFKSYDPDKMQLSFTDAGGKDQTFGWGGAKVRLNKEPTKVEDIKIGDKTLAIVEKKGDRTTLKAVMVERK